MVTFTTDSNGVLTATFTGSGTLAHKHRTDPNGNVASVVRVEGYSEIGTAAFPFNSDTPLTVTMGDSVTELGRFSFIDSGLTSITIGSGVTEIGSVPFRNCSSLISVIFEAGSSLKNINGGMFEGTSKLLSITIPASVETISHSLASNSGITTVTFEPNSNLNSLDNQAFSNSSITNVIADSALIESMGWTRSDSTDPPTLNRISLISGITVSTDQPPAPPAAAPAAICFPAGTPVTTDQGLVAIEKLNTDKHTIRGKEIVAITQTRPLQKHIVCFEKDSLSKNVPSQETRCSMQHKVFYKREMMKARDIVKLCENVSLVPYNGETLYNVLLKKQGMMMINNLICETLDPKNIMAKISTMKDGQKKHKAICQLTKIIKDNNVPEYQKLYDSL